MNSTKILSGCKCNTFFLSHKKKIIFFYLSLKSNKSTNHNYINIPQNRGANVHTFLLFNKEKLKKNCDIFTLLINDLKNSILIALFFLLTTIFNTKSRYPTLLMKPHFYIIVTKRDSNNWY